MKNLNKKKLAKSFLIVSGVILGIIATTNLIMMIPKDAIVPILGVGAFLISWYIVYDILN